VRVRVRLGAGLNRFAAAPNLAFELPETATVDDLLAALADDQPQLAPALRSALPVLGGAHVERARPLADGEEVALLMPVAGGG
jgi:molybdopterin synthase sulfur carrier subunit